jgi:hypothetical protein
MLPPSLVRVAGTVAAVKDCDFCTMSATASTIATASSSALLLWKKRPLPTAAVRDSRSFACGDVVKPTM